MDLPANILLNEHILSASLRETYPDECEDMQQSSVNTVTQLTRYHKILTPYRKFSCTGIEVVPCSLGDIISSAPYTRGPFSLFGKPQAETDAGLTLVMMGRSDTAAKFDRNARRF